MTGAQLVTDLATPLLLWAGAHVLLVLVLGMIRSAGRSQ